AMFIKRSKANHKGTCELSINGCRQLRQTIALSWQAITWVDVFMKRTIKKNPARGCEGGRCDYHHRPVSSGLPHVEAARAVAVVRLLEYCTCVSVVADCPCDNSCWILTVQETDNDDVTDTERNRAIGLVDSLSSAMISEITLQV
ncbi:hypothetical protein J6590_005671, partial [Homalodisca vitripennis]